jgi:hypothetical protein
MFQLILLRLKMLKLVADALLQKWQPGPYAAGQDFNITIGFNGYTEGQFNKVVTVYFKGGLSQLIKFHGETYKAPENPAPGNGAVQQLKSGGK